MFNERLIDLALIILIVLAHVLFSQCDPFELPPVALDFFHFLFNLVTLEFLLTKGNLLITAAFEALLSRMPILPMTSPVSPFALATNATHLLYMAIVCSATMRSNEYIYT